MTDEPDTATYALQSGRASAMPVPRLAYLPPKPHTYRPRIGLIGAGGIAASHLDAYRSAGWEVVAICNRTRDKAAAKAAEYFPKARVSADAADILGDASIDVVDITPHPADRLELMHAALKAGKHVLSQKPFVLDLDEGARLADLAEARGLKLAVNQNGRWAPHLSWMREAVRAGHIGDLVSCHASIHWNHGWIAGTPFERIEDLILYDFGIHWFDFIASLVGDRAETVFATSSHAPGQTAKVPLLANAMVQLAQGGHASLTFDGGVPYGARDTTFVAGSHGSLQSDGPDLGQQSVTLTTSEGRAVPELQGSWFNDGFAGAMGALLVAIETGGEPANGARENLASLAMAFAAIASRRTGRVVPVGSVRRVEI